MSETKIKKKLIDIDNITFTLPQVILFITCVCTGLITIMTVKNMMDMTDYKSEVRLNEHEKRILTMEDKQNSFEKAMLEMKLDVQDIKTSVKFLVEKEGGNF